MVKKIKDLVVSVGKYESQGKSKNRYVTIGGVFTNDKGGEFIMINRTFSPAGVPNPDNKDSIIVSSFDVVDKVDNSKDINKDLDASTSNPMEDQSIPF